MARDRIWDDRERIAREEVSNTPSHNQTVTLKVRILKDTGKAILVELTERGNRNEWFPVSTLNSIKYNKETKIGTINVEYWIVKQKGLG